ncbi:unnamed protein product, partial [Meganyctiphanes norvegica]
ILEMKYQKNQYVSKDRAQNHVDALVIAYQGVYQYAKWKFMQNNHINNEDNKVEQLQDGTVSSSQDMNFSILGLIQNHQEDSSNSKVLGNEALITLKKALEKLEEPCEFALGPFLELQFEMNGLEDTLNTMNWYRNKFADHLPGKKLLYYVLSENLGAENSLQMEMLKEICTMCDQDPLVLIYVDKLIQEANADETLSQFRERENDDPDSGLEDSLDNSAGESEEDENQNQTFRSFSSVGLIDSEYVCSLLPEGYIEILVMCVRLLTRFLEYPQFRDHLPAWQRLTLILKRLHHAWLRCWYCLKCEHSKKKLRVIRRKLNCLWKFIIWKQPANDMPLEEAQVLMNKAYAAHVFCFS